MRKILLALNDHDVKTSGIDFASYIANLTRSSVTGMFLEKNYKKEHAETLVLNEDSHEYEQVLPGVVKTNIQLFENRCINNCACYSIRRLSGNPTRAIIRESRFADVIITDSNESFNGTDGWPSVFVKDLLENAKCPVMIAPFSFDEINEIIFAYDGTDSSIFALKQFTYLFPEFGDKKITLLQVLQEGDEDITEKEKVKEFLMTHYQGVHYTTLRGEAEMELFKTFLTQRNKLMVMGAYGRRRLAGHSTADLLMKTTDIAMFIAHR
ncbi:MAG TPA: hypothetical protein VG847_13970 [Chitinophagaceae bacterium]|nr:hypothetical protein [Chitinophagaceae bacterium]